MGDLDSLRLVSDKWRKSFGHEQPPYVINKRGTVGIEFAPENSGNAMIEVASATGGVPMSPDELRDLAAQLVAAADFLEGVKP